MPKLISGIQQLGIGVSNVHEAWKWYRQNFNIDVKIFEEAATAGLMLPYTGGKPQERHAVLCMNMQGGGGMEVWQYTGRTPQPPAFEIQLGDLGFFAGKIKSKNVTASYNEFKKKQLNLVGVLSKDAGGEKNHFFVKDPYNNIFEIAESKKWFKPQKWNTGGVYGACIGVTNMQKSIDFYSHILGYNEAVYDKEGVFEDLAYLPGGKNKFRRVLLRHGQPRVGSFSKMLGPSKIELFQVLDREPKKIYKDRFWGDLGFIHLCFDINGMDDLRKECEAYGHPFTVDSSNSFDMGEAAGHFSYIEDPDGALIEFVETHKVPIMKKLGWYLDLRKRNPEQDLPKWMINALRFSRVKD
ncbi:MAG: VOC family protein [Bacteroidetes bacterium]|jgi:catechol 2,3-dioxygenase-like lactoylglutathione lyase family enzyme|nr:VOC family protein [Bacteroidota bacterium]MBT5527848.1 VOC family protein [Cytophagia bacterium]MBT3800901.1 VOC family protein [Bacteroidota bacterium]MBT3933581.1 VOC family protein [Bacteroidota bacterium]MBT4728718.1 VOC family protein [Bacteroidota bacterium]